MPYTSAKSWFAAHNGARVLKTVEGVPCLEDWETISAECMEQLRAQGCPEDKIELTDKGLFWPGAFLLKPKLRKAATGTLKVRSKDYGFTPDDSDRPIWGDKAGAVVDGEKLIKTYPSGMIVTFQKAEA